MLLKFSQNLQEKKDPFFNKVGGLRTYFIKNKTLAQVPFCEFCKIFKNTYFEDHLRRAASVANMHNPG